MKSNGEGEVRRRKGSGVEPECACESACAPTGGQTPLNSGFRVLGSFYLENIPFQFKPRNRGMDFLVSL